MTKLIELLNAYNVAYADAWDAAWEAWIAYLAELEKTQERTND